MEIVQIISIGIIATIISIIFKSYKPEFSIFVSITAGILILVLLIGKIVSVIELLSNITEKMEIDTVYFSTLLKIVGIAYITEFGSQICKDAGENTIASKIELGGKILVMILAVPILIALMELIIDILP
ncbi:MAG: stage III sporulation protein AD [Clostridia bacterium]|nr:stage III sporulation protein AD [Clostridia bacterium]